MTTNMTPPGEGMFDAKGRWVPQRLIKELDLLRHDTVLGLIAQAQEMSRQLGAFKTKITADLQAFLDLSAEQYEVSYGGKKGNVTLTTFDGRFKIRRSVADRLVFDERLQTAKGLIDECIHRWSQGSSDEIRALVEHAFQTDKEGKVSTERVLGLRRLAITDEKWLEAMKAIADSITVASSKSYIRFYERIDSGSQAGSYRAISLDLASVGEGL